MNDASNIADSTSSVNANHQSFGEILTILSRIADGIDKTNSLLSKRDGLPHSVQERRTEKFKEKKSYNQKKSYAIAVLAPHLHKGTIPSKAEIAREVDVPVRTLSGWPEFDAAYKLLLSRSGVGSIRRGSKSSDGDMEAVE